MSHKQLTENIFLEEATPLKRDLSANCKMCCSKIQHQLAYKKKKTVSEKPYLSPFPSVASEKWADDWSHPNYRLTERKHIITSPKSEIRMPKRQFSYWCTAEGANTGYILKTDQPNNPKTEWQSVLI